jgi:hypothetical protein
VATEHAVTGSSPTARGCAATGCLGSVQAGAVVRSLWGWSPPPLPASGTWARRVDRYLPRTGLPFVLFVAVIVALLNLAPLLPESGGLALEAAAFIAAGSWCALNFWRCRQVHCAISATGWLGLGALTAIEAAIGRSLIGGREQLAFAVLLALALAFEVVWYVGRGTNRLAATRDA